MKKVLPIIGKTSLIKIKLIFCVLYAFSPLSDISAQKYPKSLVIEKDTVICFTTNQAKKLALINEENKMLKQTLSISDNQQVKLQEIISNQENIIENSKVIERKYLELLNSYEVEKKANDKVRSMLKRQILKQTIFKYISIGAGVLTSGFLTYKLITK
jgi:hypothetical protein